MKAHRAWGTWQAARPLSFQHLPSGLSITPLVFAASIGRASFLPPSDLTYGSHALDSSDVSARIHHAGTELNWHWQKTSQAHVSGGWQSLKSGEWGLRFWVCLILEGALWQWQDQAAVAKKGATYFAIVPNQKPLLITDHNNPQALKDELEDKGYWYLASRAEKGKCLSLRFNLDEMPQMNFTIAEGKSAKQAIANAKAKSISQAAQNSPANPLTALRDILGWNSLWDGVNKRAYTACSRNWDMGKFGGFGVWLTDTGLNAMLLSSLEPEMARENFNAIMSHQTTQGNFPCLVTGHDAWLDRTQPPLTSLFVWQAFQQDGDVKWLKDYYAKLARNHAWWWKNRDGNHNGILEYGSSQVGQGLYIGTKLAAKDESFMDNSPMHDEATWQEKSRTLDMEDVGLNSLLALDAEILAKITSTIEKPKAAEKHSATAQQLREKISQHFWDEKRQVFANRLWSGKFADAITPTSFYPLLCRAASKAQTKAMLKTLQSETYFGGKFGLPSVARQHPSFQDDVYWRGRIWPILNWLVWLSLKRQGEWKAAQALREKSINLFHQSWKDRHAPENFNANDGRPTGPDTDLFYSWTALLPAMEIAGLVDIDPFDGWILLNEGNDQSLGPINSPWGKIYVKREKGCVWLAREDGTIIFSSHKKGRVKVDYRE